MPCALGVLSALARESSNSSLYCMLPEVVIKKSSLAFIALSLAFYSPFFGFYSFLTCANQE